VTLIDLVQLVMDKDLSVNHVILKLEKNGAITIVIMLMNKKEITVQIIQAHELEIIYIED